MHPSSPAVKHANRLAKQPLRRSGTGSRRSADADIAAAGLRHLNERGIYGLYEYAHSPGQFQRYGRRVAQQQDNPLVREGLVHDLTKFYDSCQEARDSWIQHKAQHSAAASDTQHTHAQPTDAAPAAPVSSISSAAAVTVPWPVLRRLMAQHVYNEEDDQDLLPGVTQVSDTHHSGLEVLQAGAH